MTLLTLQRVYNNTDETLGILTLDGELQCFTLEDEWREIKVHSESRIPKGVYQIKLRTEGGMNAKYKDRFGADFHHGMLELQEVPGFTYIYIHIGNSDDDTSGCILTGNKANMLLGGEVKIEDSTVAYKRLYSKVIGKIDDLWIQIID